MSERYSIDDYSAIAARLREIEGKAPTPTPPVSKATANLKAYCLTCYDEGWQHTGVRWRVCPVCGNPKGRSHP